jgi:hypothetical protein
LCEPRTPAVRLRVYVDPLLSYVSPSAAQARNAWTAGGVCLSGARGASGASRRALRFRHSQTLVETKKVTFTLGPADPRAEWLLSPHTGSGSGGSHPTFPTEAAASVGCFRWRVPRGFTVVKLCGASRVCANSASSSGSLLRRGRQTNPPTQGACRIVLPGVRLPRVYWGTSRRNPK